MAFSSALYNYFRNAMGMEPRRLEAAQREAEHKAWLEAQRALIDKQQDEAMKWARAVMDAVNEASEDDGRQRPRVVSMLMACMTVVTYDQQKRSKAERESYQGMFRDDIARQYMDLYSQAFAAERLGTALFAGLMVANQYRDVLYNDGFTDMLYAAMKSEDGDVKQIAKDWIAANAG